MKHSREYLALVKHAKSLGIRIVILDFTDYEDGDELIPEFISWLSTSYDIKYICVNLLASGKGFYQQSNWYNRHTESVTSWRQNQIDSHPIISVSSVLTSPAVKLILNITPQEGEYLW